MNKENEEEMLSLTVTFTLKECSALFALVASIIILERGDATPFQNVIRFLLKFGLENGLT